MYKLYYYRPEAGVSDIRFFKTKFELGQWLDMQNELENIEVIRIEEVGSCE